MPNNSIGYAVGSIAGVPLTFDGDDVKVLVLDGGSLQFGFTAVVSRDADGGLVQQIYSGTNIGAQFGVLLEVMPIEVMNAVMDAVKAAVLVGDAFNVTLEDDFLKINEQCTWDFDQLPRGPVIPQQRTDDVYINQVTLRFIVTE